VYPFPGIGVPIKSLEKARQFRGPVKVVENLVLQPFPGDDVVEASIREKIVPSRGNVKGAFDETFLAHDISN
jgi:hypothetical protein